MGAARTTNDQKAKGQRFTSATLSVVDDLPDAPPVGLRELDILDRLGAPLDEVLLPSASTTITRRDASPNQASSDEASDKRKSAPTN